MVIGLMGSSNLKELLIQAIGADGEYSFVDMEPQKNHKNLVVNRIIRILYFIHAIRKVDVVYFIFIRKNTGVFARIANRFKKKIIYHWVGSDVYALLCKKNQFGVHNERVDMHLAYAPNLVDELHQMGIESKLFTIVPTGMDSICAQMPKEHAVLLSIPDNVEGRAEFYGYNEIIEVIKTFKDIKFYVTRSEHPELYPYNNVIFKGIISSQEMNKLYNDISIIIRWPKHDGQSLLLMEGTIKGKYMIYNHKLPFTIQGETVEDMCDIMQNILSSAPVPQKKASEYGIQNYSIEKCKSDFDELMRDIKHA